MKNNFQNFQFLRLFIVTITFATLCCFSIFVIGIIEFVFSFAQNQTFLTTKYFQGNYSICNADLACLYDYTQYPVSFASTNLTVWRVFVALTFILGLAGFITIGYLLGYHIFLNCKGLTTYEHVTRNRNLEKENIGTEEKTIRNSDCSCKSQPPPKKVPKKISEDLDSLRNEGTSVNKQQKISTIADGNLRMNTSHNLILPPLIPQSASRPLPKLPKFEDGTRVNNKTRKKKLKPIDDPFELDDFTKAVNFIKQSTYMKAADEPDKEESENREEYVKHNKINLGSDDGGSILTEQNIVRSSMTPPIENYTYKPTSSLSYYNSKQGAKL